MYSRLYSSYRELYSAYNRRFLFDKCTPANKYGMGKVPM
jgi:hypothetical protein